MAVVIVQSLKSCPTLQPQELMNTKLPCPLLSLQVGSNSCPLSRWCYPTISFSIDPFACLQSFPASGSFPMSQFFTSGGQSTGVSASTSVLPMNSEGWFPLGLASVTRGVINRNIFEKKLVEIVYNISNVAWEVRRYHIYLWCPKLWLWSGAQIII